MHHGYVAFRDDNRIARFTVDSTTAQLDWHEDLAVEGGPAPLAISPARDTLYVGQRDSQELASYRIVGRFTEVTPEAGGALLRPTVARGAAYGDLDRDGDLDLLIAANNGPARVLRNEGGNANNVLRVRTEGTASNRDGIGARVEVMVDGGQLWQIVKTGSSYASQSELPVTFGLGAAIGVDTLTVTWPSGAVDQVAHVEANQEVTVREGEGAVAMQPFER